MKLRWVVLLAIVAASCLFAACGDDDSITGTDQTDLDRPPIPEPTYYAGPVPQRSMELILKTVPLSNFVAAADSIWTQWCCDTPGCDFGCEFYPTYPGHNRLRLVENDSITTNTDSLTTDVYYNPAMTNWGPMLCYPLSSHPYLQHVRYWVRLGDVERYSGSTSLTVTRSVTRGVERTEAEEFGMSIGMETTASGGFFVDFSVTLRTEFSYSSSVELSVSEETTTEEAFTISCPDNKNIVYCVWQLVDEFRIIGVDGQVYSDPNYRFFGPSLTAICPSNEFVPMTTYFDNP